MADGHGVDELFSLAYEELRRLAAVVRRDHAVVTLNPTALVHEAWLKLAGSPSLPVESRLHFKRVAARAMRQVLVDAARRRNALKRGGDAVLVTFDGDLDGSGGQIHRSGTTAAEVLALDAALQELSQVAPRQASMVESRFFGGLETAEIAELLDVSQATVMRDWRAARAWLARRLRPGAREADGG